MATFIFALLIIAGRQPDRAGSTQPEAFRYILVTARKLGASRPRN